MTETAEAESSTLYDAIELVIPLGLPFAAVAVSRNWHDWPSLPNLFPTSFPGVKTSRDAFLIDVDLDRLKERVRDYFNSELSHEEIARRYPSVMNSSARFNSRAVRDSLLKRDESDERSGFVRYAYRPFDDRWLYWEAETKLLDEKRSSTTNTPSASPTTNSTYSREICGFPPLNICGRAQGNRKPVSRAI